MSLKNPISILINKQYLLPTPEFLESQSQNNIVTFILNAITMIFLNATTNH